MKRIILINLLLLLLLFSCSLFKDNNSNNNHTNNNDKNDNKTKKEYSFKIEKNLDRNKLNNPNNLRITKENNELKVHILLDKANTNGNEISILIFKLENENDILDFENAIINNDTSYKKEWNGGGVDKKEALKTTIEISSEYITFNEIEKKENDNSILYKVDLNVFKNNILK